jgi:hypothetical protein
LLHYRQCERISILLQNRANFSNQQHNMINKKIKHLFYKKVGGTQNSGSVSVII